MNPNGHSTLHNGVTVPAIGFGTWLIDNDQVTDIALAALQAGFRHIDSAQAYENEEGVGKAVRLSGLTRKDVFVTTKVAAEIKDHKQAAMSIQRSIERLGLDYIDLMLIHCPQPWAEFRSEKNYNEGNVAVWHALEEAYQDGKIRAIGVSNFLQNELQNILDHCSIRPMVNQIFTHAGNTPVELIDWCKKQDIIVEAYSPLGHGRLLENPKLKAIAERYGVSVPQICIRYCLQMNLLPLPKTTNKTHIKNNLAVDFTISEEDMHTLMQWNL